MDTKIKYVVRKDELKTCEYLVMLKEENNQQYTVFVFATSPVGLIQGDAVCAKSFTSKWLAKRWFRKTFKQFQKRVNWNYRNCWK